MTLSRFGPRRELVHAVAIAIQRSISSDFAVDQHDCSGYTRNQFEDGGENRMRKEAEVKKPKLRPLHPRREMLSREEELRRFRSIEEWRSVHLDEFKKTHPKVHDPD